MTVYPWSFSPSDPVSVESLSLELSAARDRAHEDPWREGMVVECALSGVAVSSIERPLPSFVNSKAGTTTSFRLDRPLQSGDDKWSQVWLAQALPVHSDSNASSFAIVKIIQPSLCRIPQPNENNTWTYREPEEVAMREVEFYEKARELQGSVIPYLYGHRKV